MSLIDVGRKAAVYGFRHVLQSFDYHLLRGLAAPDKVALVLTNRCNCRCVMCDLWRARDAGNELPAERWMALLDELHAWTRTLRVRFVGGEVLLKPGVYDIIRRAVDLGFTVNLISNGLALQSERNYRDLMNTGLRHITFSVDGKDAAIHDRNRGTPGLHDVVTEVIRRIKRERPVIGVSLICILMRETVPQLAEYVQWAEELGVDGILFQPLAENVGRPEKRPDWHRESDLFVRDLETLEDSIDALNRRGRHSAHMEMPLRPLREMREYFVRPESFQIRQGPLHAGADGHADRSLGNPIYVRCQVHGLRACRRRSRPGSMEKRTGPRGTSGDPGVPAALRLDVQSLPRTVGEGCNLSTVRASGQTVKMASRGNPATSASTTQIRKNCVRRYGQ